MNIFKLVWKNITQQLGSAMLSILLTAFGVAILAVIYVTSDAFDKQLSNNSQHVDLVVGAKGSPLQLILSSLYHVDNPTGNIALAEARQLEQNPFVQLAVPISLGDNYKGHRVIGTEASYLDLYQLELEQGSLWNKPFQAVIGAAVARKHNLQLGGTFHTEHGLTESAHIHDEHPFTIVGILKPSQSVNDKLILTNLESVWDVHGIEHNHDDAHKHDHEDAHKHDHDDAHKHDNDDAHKHDNDDAHKHDHDDAHKHDHAAEEPEVFVKRIGDDVMEHQGDEVTALLIQYRTPAAMAIVPKFVNQSTAMQAASPAIESARIFSLLGVGIDSLTILAYVIMLIAGLSVFISLYNALKSRRYDLAVMRSMGASATKLLSLVLVEGVVITFIGAVVGLCFGHLALYYIGQQTSESADFINAFTLYPEELIIILVAVLIGLLAALIPAIRAYNTTISSILGDK